MSSSLVVVGIDLTLPLVLEYRGHHYLLDVTARNRLVLQAVNAEGFVNEKSPLLPIEQPVQ